MVVAVVAPYNTLSTYIVSVVDDKLYPVPVHKYERTHEAQTEHPRASRRGQLPGTAHESRIRHVLHEYILRCPSVGEEEQSVAVMTEFHADSVRWVDTVEQFSRYQRTIFGHSSFSLSAQREKPVSQLRDEFRQYTVEI